MVRYNQEQSGIRERNPLVYHYIDVFDLGNHLRQDLQALINSVVTTCSGDFTRDTLREWPITLKMGAPNEVPDHELGLDLSFVYHDGGANHFFQIKVRGHSRGGNRHSSSEGMEIDEDWRYFSKLDLRPTSALMGAMVSQILPEMRPQVFTAEGTTVGSMGHLIEVNEARQGFPLVFFMNYASQVLFNLLLNQLNLYQSFNPIVTLAALAKDSFSSPQNSPALTFDHLPSSVIYYQEVGAARRFRATKYFRLRVKDQPLGYPSSQALIQCCMHHWILLGEGGQEYEDLSPRAFDLDVSCSYSSKLRPGSDQPLVHAQNPFWGYLRQVANRIWRENLMITSCSQSASTWPLVGEEWSKSEEPIPEILRQGKGLIELMLTLADLFGYPQLIVRDRTTLPGCTFPITFLRWAEKKPAVFFLFGFRPNTQEDLRLYSRLEELVSANEELRALARRSISNTSDGLQKFCQSFKERLVQLLAGDPSEAEALITAIEEMPLYRHPHPNHPRISQGFLYRWAAGS